MDTLTKSSILEYNLRCYEKDLNGCIKTSSILNFMQDAATINAEMNNFGLSYVKENNLAWYVLKYKIEFYEQFCETDKIEVKTRSRGAAKLFAYRDFYFYHNGSLFAKANSLWALIDLNSKRMVKPQDALNAISTYERQEDDLDFTKIILPESFETQKEFNIRFEDIDINKHVNNTNYLIWAIETFDFEFRKNHTVKSLDINYKKDISENGEIISKMSYDNETMTSTHLICDKNTNDELCLLKIVWQNV